jgi:DNA-binding transcriptional LysR family regulator
MDWEDVRYFLAVAEAGTATGAAKVLRSSPSTVIKRVGDLERALGHALFDRSRDGYALTEFGRAVAYRATPFRNAADDIGRLVAGSPSQVSGVVRIATTEVFATEWLPRLLPALRQAHPGISVELAPTSQLVSLARREADLALRLVRPTKGELVARKVADVGYVGYESNTQAVLSTPRQWIAFEESPATTAIGRAIEKRLGGRTPVLRAPTFGIHQEAARAGLGAALLPCFVGDADARLIRVADDPEPPLVLGLWLVVHRDLKEAPRVRAVFEHLVQAAAGDRGRLLGSAEFIRRLEPS